MAVRTETLSQATGQPLGARELDLDRDRTASMADEGGVAGALVDLRDQLAEIDESIDQSSRQAWARSLIWGGVALGAAAVIAGAIWLRKR